MHLVASYRNTERSARYTAPATEEQRMASQIAFMERRKAELGSELKTLVKAREKAIQRLAYERKLAQAELERDRVRFAQEIAEHEKRLGEILAAITKRTHPRVDAGYVPTFDKIAERVCRAFKVSLLDLLSDKQDRPVANCRQAFCYWAVRRTGASTVQIGKFLARDHSTVLHGKRTYVAKRAAQGRTLREVR
jgi:chromosomal replication initiation ATPase DnaA